MTTPGQELRAKREAAGLNLRELARRAGMSAMYLCDIELGRRDGSPKVWDRLRSELGTGLAGNPKALAIELLRKGLVKPGDVIALANPPANSRPRRARSRG